MNRLIPVLALLAGSVFLAQPAVAADAADTTVSAAKKYFVCKFVGKPGVDEVLKAGKNPISVARSAIDSDPVVIGAPFADAQGRSFVLAEDVGQADPKAAACAPFVAPTPVTAEAPSATDPTCEVDGALVLPTTKNVTYESSPEGAGPGHYTVTATAAQGYALTGDGEFEITVLDQSAAPDCEVNGLLPATAEPPSVTDATCTAAGELVIPITDNVSYEVTPSGDGFDVVATADTGYYLTAPGVYAIEAPDDQLTDCAEPTKVFVCKFVGTPGPDEVLKGGKQPISVSVNSIDPEFVGDPADLIGLDFADGQEFSRVLAVDDGGPAPSITECSTSEGPIRVAAEPPTADPATCEDDGMLNVPTSDEAVTYESTPAGETGPGAYTVTATAAEGFTLVGTSVFEITVDEQLPATECIEPGGLEDPKPDPDVAGEDALLPDTGGLPLAWLLLAGPMTAAGLLVMRNRSVAHAFAGGSGPRHVLTLPPVAESGFRKMFSRVAAAFGSLFAGRR